MPSRSRLRRVVAPPGIVRPLRFVPVEHGLDRRQRAGAVARAARERRSPGAVTGHRGYSSAARSLAAPHSSQDRAPPPPHRGTSDRSSNSRFFVSIVARRSSTIASLCRPRRPRTRPSRMRASVCLGSSSSDCRKSRSALANSSPSSPIRLNRSRDSVVDCEQRSERCGPLNPRVRTRRRTSISGSRGKSCTASLEMPAVQSVRRPAYTVDAR